MHSFRRALVSTRAALFNVREHDPKHGGKNGGFGAR